MADQPRKSFAGRGVYPAEHAGWLLTPLRRLIMPPERMVRRLALKPADHVLEIGPGPGWFSPTLAKAVPDGRLVLFDIQRQMLDMAGKRLSAAGAANFELVEGDATRLPFAGNAFDLVFMVTVLGEIGDASAALREIARVLKPGRRVSITEQLGDPDHVARSALRRMAEAAGFGVERITGSAMQYTASLRKPGQKDP